MNITTNTSLMTKKITCEIAYLLHILVLFLELTSTVLVVRLKMHFLDIWSSYSNYISIIILSGLLYVFSDFTFRIGTKKSVKIINNKNHLFC